MKKITAVISKITAPLLLAMGLAAAQSAVALESFPSVNDPAEKGPYEDDLVSYSIGEKGGNDSCTIIYPQGRVLDGTLLLHPVVVWGPGTGMTSDNKRPYLEHLASHGFIIAASDDKSSGNGETMSYFP